MKVTLLPGGITATVLTKRPLRISAPITIYFIRDITCRWGIYYPPEVHNCAGKHWLSPTVTLQKELSDSHGWLKLFWEPVANILIFHQQAGVRFLLMTVK